MILTTMPQKFQTERRYVNTFLKLLYYSHALRRFIRPRPTARRTICSSSGPTKHSDS